MKLNNKGLTLVELIAVLIILILIFLLAVTKVNDLMDDAEANSVRADAISYVKAVNSEFSLVNSPELEPIYKGLYTLDELNEIGIKVSGTKPTGGHVYNINNKTIYGCLEYKKRKAIIENDVVTKVQLGKCKITTLYEKTDMYQFDATSSEATYTIPKTGKYLLEVWGAQGGNTKYTNTTENSNTGGYGAYSRAYINLNKDDVLYINVGGKGASSDYNQSTGTNSFDKGKGYNGGGYATYYANNSARAGGGGATSVALESGLLSTFKEKVDKLLIVAGGGGGAATHASYPSYSGDGGSAGGYLANNGKTSNTTCYNYGLGGSQTAAGSYAYCSSDGRSYRSDNPPANAGFGYGSNYTSNIAGRTYAGGGGGYYGGGSGWHGPGGGGSSYIGNTNLIDAVMYCYDCFESNGSLTKTISTNCHSSKPIKECTKEGNGFASIVLVEEINE